MCGIFGYRGKQNASKMVMEGLKRLDYRGYDSWGIAVNTDSAIEVTKDVGKVGTGNIIRTLSQSNIAIGHTRWATHGAVTQLNAHPHFSTDHSFVVAQNGIVENYEVLKRELEGAGYAFTTQTDTEVIVRLIEDKLKRSKITLVQAVRSAFLDLDGRNTIIVLHNSGDIIAARNGSPLLLGLNKKTDELFISSDSLSISTHTTEMVVLDNNQMVVCQGKQVSLLDCKTGKELPLKPEKMNFKAQTLDKGEYPHYMVKEINETPRVIQAIIDMINEYEPLTSKLAQFKTVYTIGSGTAGGAAAQIAYYLRTIAGINAVSLVGADARDYYHLFSNKDLIIAPSQSGETADVLEVLEIAKSKGVKIASYVNMPGSMMSRVSDFAYMSHAGAEICVMSTKIYMSQIVWGYVLAKLASGEKKSAVTLLKELKRRVEEQLQSKKLLATLQKTADYLAKQQHIFILGKGQNFQIAKEGMIKMIEGSYIHAHAIPAGDLKHYAITLIEKGTPVVALLSNDESYHDVLNAIHEVKARGAYIIALAPEEKESFDRYIPIASGKEISALLNVVPLQLIAYYMAVTLGNDVDKPRNIAKSVTVK